MMTMILYQILTEFSTDLEKKTENSMIIQMKQRWLIQMEFFIFIKQEQKN